jgi:hypothetical protein
MIVIPLFLRVLQAKHPKELTKKRKEMIEKLKGQS